MATAGVTTTQFDDAAIRGTVKDAFVATYKETTPLWKSTLGFEEEETNRPFEEWTSFTEIGLAARKEQLQQVAIDVPKQNYTKRINVIAYAIMVPASEEAIRFLKAGTGPLRTVVQPAQMAARSMKQTNEVLASDVYGNAFSSSFTGMDGVALVSASHKLGRGGTDSNYIGTVSLSQSGIEAAMVQSRSFKDDVGLPVGIMDGKRILVIPPAYEFEAERILTSTLQSNTANNAINTLKDKNISPQVNRYLPSSTNWFIRNMGEKQCLIALFETKPNLDDFGDDKTMTKYFRAYEMCAFDFGLNWRGIQGSDF